MATDHVETLQSLRDHFARHAGCNLWHAVILSTSWVRSPEGPDPWEMVAVHERLASYPVVRRMPVELRDQGVFDGRFFGERERLEAFLSMADGAYRWLQEGPLRDLADRAVPPVSPRCYADCWLAVVYSLAWEHESHLLLARERSLCESVGPGEASAFYHVRFAFMKCDVFTMSEEAVRLLQARAAGATLPGHIKAAVLTLVGSAG
jgi:hypothetical protein